MSSRRESSSYDAAILGGGSAGYAAARTAAAAGLRTVVIEGGPEVGGLCILRGCMPSKALLYAAEVLHLARAGQNLGPADSQGRFRFHRRDGAEKGDGGGFRRMPPAAVEPGAFCLFAGARAFRGPAHPGIKRRKGAKRQLLSARHFIICTGSVPAPAPCPGLEETGFLTSDEALALPAPPRSLVVLGGGPVAVELAQLFCRMDVKVTLLQRSEQVLREFDADAAAALETVLRREGVEIFAPTRLARAFRKGRSKVVEFEHAQRTTHRRGGGNPRRHGTHAKHGGVGAGSHRRPHGKGPDPDQRGNAIERAAYLRGGGLHRAASDCASRRGAGRSGGAQHRASPAAGGAWMTDC